MRGPITWSAGTILATSLACGLCAAQEASPQHLIVSVGAQRMPGADGGNVRADWVRSFESGVLSAGVNRTDIGTSRWTLLSVGGARPSAHGWTLAGGVDYGPATIAGDGTTFTKLRAGLSFPVSSKWTVRVQDSFVNVMPVSGHLLSSGARVERDNGLSFDMQLSEAVAGNLDERSAAFRLDYRAKAPYLMAGMVLGTSNNRLLLNVPDAEATSTRLRQGFVGLTMPLDEMDLTVAMEVAKVGDFRRTSLSCSLRFPLASAR